MRVASWRLLLLWLVVATAAVPAAAETAAEPRLALVIGNADYADQSLKNPVNDAKAMAASLRRLGFDVIERVNAGKKAMEDAALEFGEKLKAGGIGLFYYAGHGVQTRGHNYLVPVDAQISSEASVRVQAFDVGLVLDLMSDARNRANVVILDACRNNPFRGLMRGASPGLAAIDAGRGTLIAYSTAPGAVAVDGDGTNSPYTAALVKALAEPGMKAEEMFKRVRGRVVEVTRGAQTPWESSSLTGDLILNFNVTVNPPPPAATAGTRDAVEVAFWQSIAGSSDARDYQDYLAQFPNGAFSALAKRRAAELGRKQQAAVPPAKSEPPKAEAPSKPIASKPIASKPAIEPIERDFTATQTARLREAPDVAGRQIASLTAGQTVKVLGKVKDQNWLLVERPDGTTGYVAATLMEEAEAYRTRREAEEERKRREAETEREAAKAVPPPPPVEAPPPVPAPPVPAPPATIAAAPVASPPPAPAPGFDGVWRGQDKQWSIELIVEGSAVRGKARCTSAGTYNFTGSSGADGAVRADLRGSRLEPRVLSGSLPRLRLSPGGNCGGAELDMQRSAGGPAPAPTQAASAATATAATPPADTRDLRQRAYERIIAILLGQTVATGTDQGKRNDYRAAPRPKAIAACVDWSARSVGELRVGSWASSWIPPGAMGVPPRQHALETCTKGNDQPARCVCQIVDENDANALELPAEFARRAGTP